MGNYLGQYFLKNKEKLRKIVEALELKDGDVVIEIGPGHGELTKELRMQNSECRIIAIEKDKKLAEDFKEKFKGDKNIEIIEGDALKVLPRLIQNSEFRIKNYKIVGNIPYYITGYLFRILGGLEYSEEKQASYTSSRAKLTTGHSGAGKPELIVLLIQKEVAERVCAKSPQINLLAASVQIWAEPKIIGYVSRNDFKPAPKVDSAIIKLTPVTFQLLSRLKCNNEKYYKFIKILFKQPRKTIVNNLMSEIAGKNTAILSDSTLSDRIAGDKVNKNNITLDLLSQAQCNKNEPQIINKTKIKEEIIEKLKLIGVEPNARPQNLSVERIIALSNS